MSDSDVEKDPKAANDDLIGGFDETNGIVSGLDGESDGTHNGEDYSAGDPEGKHGWVYRLAHPGDSEDRRAP
jgi:hypothetical protein